MPAREPKSEKRQKQPPAKISAPAYCTRGLGNLAPYDQDQDQDEDQTEKCYQKLVPGQAKVCVLCQSFCRIPVSPKKDSFRVERSGSSPLKPRGNRLIFFWPRSRNKNEWRIAAKTLFMVHQNLFTKACNYFNGLYPGNAGKWTV